MSDLSLLENPDSDPHHTFRRVSFDRLREDGAAVLLGAPDLGIHAVFLVAREHRWVNPYNLRTIWRGDDLFAASARFPDSIELFPKGAELLPLTLEFIFENFAEPCPAVLAPPDGLLVQNPAFAERIEIFLVRRGLVTILGPAATAAAARDSQARVS